jgi:hypothetical protein
MRITAELYREKLAEFYGLHGYLIIYPERGAGVGDIEKRGYTSAVVDGSIVDQPFKLIATATIGEAVEQHEFCGTGLTVEDLVDGPYFRAVTE